MLLSIRTSCTTHLSLTHTAGKKGKERQTHRLGRERETEVGKDEEEGGGEQRRRERGREGGERESEKLASK